LSSRSAVEHPARKSDQSIITASARLNYLGGIAREPKPAWFAPWSGCKKSGALRGFAYPAPIDRKRRRDLSSSDQGVLSHMSGSPVSVIPAKAEIQQLAEHAWNKPAMWS